MTDVIATTEATLCRILADVLDVDLVRPEDGFFEVGGDSVLAVQVVARAREAGLALGVRDLFDHQSPRALAAVTKALPDPASTDPASTDPASTDFEDTDLGDFEATDFEDTEFEDTAFSGPVGDAELGWEALT